MKYYRYNFILLLLVFYQAAVAQVALEVKGQPMSAFNGISYPEVEGHPYLEDKWLNGTVVLDNNRYVPNIYSQSVQ